MTEMNYMIWHDCWIDKMNDHDMLYMTEEMIEYDMIHMIDKMNITGYDVYMNDWKWQIYDYNVIMMWWCDRQWQVNIKWIIWL